MHFSAQNLTVSLTALQNTANSFQARLLGCAPLCAPVRTWLSCLFFELKNKIDISLRNGIELIQIQSLPDYYRVGTDLNIWSRHKTSHYHFRKIDGWHALVGYLDSYGYRIIRVGTRHRKVHQLICEAFHGPRPKGMECRHLDGDRLNNDPENLKWGTNLENIQDAIAHGNTLLGEKNPFSKLSDAQRLEVIQNPPKNFSDRVLLAQSLGVTERTIRRTINKRDRYV